MLSLFLFILGLAVGSFLNVVILRGKEEKQLSGRSICPACKKTLKFYELIPVFSFLIQKGRCRSCGAALSGQYPLVEIVTGTLFALAPVFLSFQVLNFLNLSLLLVGLSASIVIFVSDLRFEIIPNGAALILFLLGIIAVAFRYYNSPTGFETIVWDAASSLFLAAILAALWFFSQGRWMGLGDAKLILATSLILGFPASIIAFLFSFWIGGALGIILLSLKLRGLKSHIPFGPFILLGSILALLFGNWLISI